MATSAAMAKDPRRWITLAIVIAAAAISSINNTVLNVAIPSILRDFHTSLTTVQWVVSGYALTFAALLIVGGRLGDIYGHRRAFVLGAALFGLGALLASFSTSVLTLLAGEALVQGIGAALMLPASTAILSMTFEGTERATAFAAWAATVGVAAAFGPVVGGSLTTYYSWRWAVRVNVVVALLTAVAGILLIPRDVKRPGRASVDIRGAMLIGAGMFLLIFALSEGGSYGWLRPERNFTINGHVLWPGTRPVSVIPITVALSVVFLFLFYAFERATERRQRQPLFEFGSLRSRVYRYGLLTSLIVALGQLGLIFVLPIVLQNAEHLSAAETGLWLVPFGLLILIGSQIGGRLTRRLGPTPVIRVGLVAEAVGLALIAFVMSPRVDLVSLLPGYALFGVGYGFASAQLVNIILSDVAREKSGVAGAANTTVRQVGAALGVAVMGAILNAQTISRAARDIGRASLSPGVKTRALAQIHSRGVNFAVPAGTPKGDAVELRHIVASSIAAGGRPATLFAAAGALAGALVALLLPVSVPVRPSPAGPSTDRAAPDAIGPSTDRAARDGIGPSTAGPEVAAPKGASGASLTSEFGLNQGMPSPAPTRYPTKP